MKIREIIQTLFPTRTWKLAAIIAGGVLCGLGSYTLYASRAWTYLSDDPGPQPAKDTSGYDSG